MSAIPYFTAEISLCEDHHNDFIKITDNSRDLSVDSISLQHDCPAGAGIRTRCRGWIQQCQCCWPGPHGTERCDGNWKSCGWCIGWW
jgi:hypothetical protein